MYEWVNAPRAQLLVPRAGTTATDWLIDWEVLIHKFTDWLHFDLGWSADVRPVRLQTVDFLVDIVCFCVPLRLRPCLRGWTLMQTADCVCVHVQEACTLPQTGMNTGADGIRSLFMDQYGDRQKFMWLIDRLIDRLIDWLCMIDWLIDWLLDRIWLIDWLYMSVCCFCSWLIDSFIDRMIYWLIDYWFIDCFDVYQAIKQASKQASNQPIKQSIDQPTNQPTNQSINQSIIRVND